MHIKNQPIQRFFSGAPCEEKVGYCRAIRSGNFIATSGTTFLNEAGGIHAAGDAYGQAKRALEII